MPIIGVFITLYGVRRVFDTTDYAFGNFQTVLELFFDFGEIQLLNDDRVVIVLLT
ncbi:hypothetical protein GJ744_008945 [Endocarpon pusillum]|uniref:Uncharacterized protein n=1 Tax=Endocarpon pusillum TaxID=364733 RepID=A0A8H7AGI3_9EURO|nr:hypothetical protein GJ744_008945 [Endocarpon pusillum]